MPIEVVCQVCSAEYALKEELAGKKLRCRSCESVLEVPMVETEAPSVGGERGYDPAFDRDKFLVNQKRLSIGEKYYVFDEQKQPILFVHRPMRFWRQVGAALGAIAVLFVGGIATMLLAVIMDEQFQGTAAAGVLALLGILATVVVMIAVAIRLSPKRHIAIYSDDAQSRRLLEILQDRKFYGIRATYTVNDPAGLHIATFEKNYLYNMFRKRWVVFDPAGSKLVIAKEDSIILSMLRRLLGPLFGLLRTNYVFLNPDTERVIGEFNRKFTLFDRYVLDLSADRDHELDRRLGVAMAVMLDTGERR